jgi:ketosteroid isomerase-like protein
MVELRPELADDLSPSDLRAMVQRLWDLHQIRDLAHRYAVAVDARDLDTLMTLYVDDVRVGRDADGQIVTGKEAFRASFDEQLRAIGVSILFVGNHVIDFEADERGSPDRARGIVYCRGLIQDGERVVEQAIQYRDVYVRRGGRWLFLKRTHVLWWGVEMAERPYDQRPANWPEHHDGLGTVPYDLPTWQAFWDRSGADGGG